MATATITIEDVFEYVHGHADEEELDSLVEAFKARRKALSEKRALNVKVGTEVTLSGLSPKYLNGLAGTVETVNGSRADVRLNEESTQRLRFKGKRFYVPMDEETHLLTGVPKGCCTTS